MNRLPTLLILLCLTISAQAAGTFRLGIVRGEKSFWLSEQPFDLQKAKNGTLTYIFTDIVEKKSELTLQVIPLSDSEGFILEVSAKGIPDDTQLAWGFGACAVTNGEDVRQTTSAPILPALCADNVFSVEGSAFTVYYGESMKLRVVQGITPPASDIRLSDAHRQQSPLDFHRSGKKTDAPALAATCPLKSGEKLYFCFYKQNQKADYMYYMLPALFNKACKRTK